MVALGIVVIPRAGSVLFQGATKPDASCRDQLGHRRRGDVNDVTSLLRSMARAAFRGSLGNFLLRRNLSGPQFWRRAVARGTRHGSQLPCARKPRFHLQNGGPGENRTRVRKRSYPGHHPRNLKCCTLDRNRTHDTPCTGCSYPQLSYKGTAHLLELSQDSQRVHGPAPQAP